MTLQLEPCMQVTTYKQETRNALIPAYVRDRSKIYEDAPDDVVSSHIKVILESIGYKIADIAISREIDSVAVVCSTETSDKEPGRKLGMRLVKEDTGRA